MEIKASQATAFLARPDPQVRTILLFGPDQGLVSERASELVARIVGSADDPFAVVNIDVDTLGSDPSRLAEAAHALSLFGGKRAIRIKVVGPRSILPALEPVLSVPPADAMVVIEAGDLRRTAPLRKACEAARSAAAIGCYAEVDLDRVIDEEVAVHGLTIGDDARAALRLSIGADRLQSRAEIRKLCLYVDRGAITLADVRAIVADAADTDLDEVIDAAALGEIEAMTRAFRQIIAAGTTPATIVAAAQRHFQALHRGVGLVSQGGSSFDALARIHMPMGGPRRNIVERQLRLWQPASAERALQRISQALAESRLNPSLATSIVSEAFLAVASEASRRARRRG